MCGANWRETYFQRVSKAQIGQAVTEAGAGPFSLDGKKADVAAAAARLTAGTGWFPSLLRVPPVESDDEPAFAEADNDETAERLSMAAE